MNATLEAPAKSFQAPTVMVGEIVMYYRSGDRSNDGAPAIVLNANDVGILRLMYLRTGQSNELIKGARHIDDPYHAQHPDSSFKASWDLTESGHELRKISEAVADMRLQKQAVKLKPPAKPDDPNDELAHLRGKLPEINR